MSTRACDTNLNVKRIHAFKLLQLIHLLKNFKMFWVLTLAIKLFSKPFRCPATGTPDLIFYSMDTELRHMWMLAGVCIRRIVHSFLEQESVISFSFIQVLSPRLLNTVFRCNYSGVGCLYWISLWWPMVYSANCLIIYSVDLIHWCEWFIFMPHVLVCFIKKIKFCTSFLEYQVVSKF